MLGVYVHIPFCEKKCNYCDFYSIENDALTDEYIKSLCIEISRRSELYGKNIPIETIFFGGGTPSKLTASQLDKIINCISKNFDLSNLTEFTIECNPGTNFVRNLPRYKKFGINRISIGVQSFVDKELQYLDRIHTAEEAKHSIQQTLDFGFDNVNIDIIFSLPNQTLESLTFTLEQLLSFDIQHISAYSLIYEKGTKLYNELRKGKIKPLGEEEDYTFYKTINSYLSSAGFNQYEVSNYAKKSKECQHNLKYWRRCEYFGFGASAHSFYQETRYWNYRSINKYISSLKKGVLPIEGSEALDIEQRLYEDIMLGLRSSGIELPFITVYYGVNLLDSPARELVVDWENRDLATCQNNWLRLTNSGYFLCDKLTLDLLDVILPEYRQNRLMGIEPTFPNAYVHNNRDFAQT